MADQIIPKLWLGNIENSQDTEFLKEYRIKHIFNLTKKSYPQNRDIEYIQVPLTDSDNPEEQSEFMKVSNEIVDSIHNIQINNKGEVLVHCEMGIQRSCAIVAYYLMKYRSMSADDAIEYVKNKHPIAFKHRVAFLEALYRLELLL